jgi:hypothetical protein
MGIAGDARGKGLPRKARSLKQAVDKNFGIDRGIDTDRPTHECTPLKYQSIISSANVQLAMTNPCIFDDQLHRPSPKSGRLSASSASEYSTLTASRTTALEIDLEQ